MINLVLLGCCYLLYISWYVHTCHQPRMNLNLNSLRDALTNYSPHVLHLRIGLLVGNIKINTNKLAHPFSDK